MPFPTLTSLPVANKTVLLRADLNVPMQGGRVTDDTRIRRLLPTIRYLMEQKAKVVILSHFDRPKGKFVPSMSLAPLVDALSAALGQEVHFGVDCIGPDAQAAIEALQPGEVVLLENLRFYAQEESGDMAFAQELANLGDMYVNDAFSCSHRAHASIVGLAQLLPHAAGFLMQEELNALTAVFESPEKPLAAMIGGSKISTKLELLTNLCLRMDKIFIGGAMANTFLHAQGYGVGKSICEKEMAATALHILEQARTHGCEIVLPVDLIVTRQFRAHSPSHVVDVGHIPEDCTATDIGPESVMHFANQLKQCKTLVWNGPLGAFETTPFDASTVSVARHVASLTRRGNLKSVAGGGDTVAALSHAGLAGEFSYLSTAGGAFLEWLEGKALPGVEALMSEAKG